MALVAALTALLALAGCSSGHSGHFDGLVYPQKITVPALVLPSTRGGRLNLHTACHQHECVLAFVALSDAQARAFLRALGSAANGISPRPVVVAATIDPAHDTLSRLREEVQRSRIIGVRGRYGITEGAARSVSVDIEPPTTGPVPGGEPQAVLFRPDGVAAVGWSLTEKASELHNDLEVANPS